MQPRTLTTTVRRPIRLWDPDPTGFETHVFFYEGPDGLSLNFFSNKDEVATPTG